MATCDASFRRLLVELSEELSEEDLTKLKYLYLVNDEEYSKCSLRFQFFELLVKRGNLSSHNGDQLDQLALNLKSIKKTELSNKVEQYKAENLRPQDLLLSEAIQETQDAVQASIHDFPGFRAVKRRRLGMHSCIHYKYFRFYIGLMFLNCR